MSRGQRPTSGAVSRAEADTRRCYFRHRRPDFDCQPDLAARRIIASSNPIASFAQTLFLEERLRGCDRYPVIDRRAQHVASPLPTRSSQPASTRLES
jgi:hypothetical protein